MGSPEVDLPDLEFNAESGVPAESALGNWRQLPRAAIATVAQRIALRDASQYARGFIAIGLDREARIAPNMGAAGEQLEGPGDARLAVPSYVGKIRLRPGSVNAVQVR